MREILFRGKRVDNGEWVVGYYSPVNIPLMGCIGHFINENGYKAVEIAPETVGQYTGKEVKNGKVFEGDIGVSVDGLFLVCWDDDKAAFVMRFCDYPYETLYLEEMWYSAEIIGNIHDNPELMEGGKDNGYSEKM